MLRFLRAEPADAAADEAADLVAVEFLKIHSRIFERLPAGVDAQLRKAIRAPHFLGVWKSRGGIEALDLRGDLAGEIADVERRHAVYAALAGDDFLPKCLHFAAERRGDAHTGDHYPFACYTSHFY